MPRALEAYDRGTCSTIQNFVKFWPVDGVAVRLVTLHGGSLDGRRAWQFARIPRTNMAGVIQDETTSNNWTTVASLVDATTSYSVWPRQSDFVNGVQGGMVTSPASSLMASAYLARPGVIEGVLERQLNEGADDSIIGLCNWCNRPMTLSNLCRRSGVCSGCCEIDNEHPVCSASGENFTRDRFARHLTWRSPRVVFRTAVEYRNGEARLAEWERELLAPTYPQSLYNPVRTPRPAPVRRTAPAVGAPVMSQLDPTIIL